MDNFWTEYEKLLHHIILWRWPEPKLLKWIIPYCQNRYESSSVTINQAVVKRHIQWMTFTNDSCLVSPLYYWYIYFVRSDFSGKSISWHMFKYLLSVKFTRNVTSQNKNLIVQLQHQTGKKWVLFINHGVLLLQNTFYSTIESCDTSKELSLVKRSFTKIITVISRKIYKTNIALPVHLGFKTNIKPDLLWFVCFYNTHGTAWF